MPARTSPKVAPVPAKRPESTTQVALQYVGATGLTVFGGVTRTRYRFVGPGAVLRVDARDAPTMAAIPSLRPIVI
jgi:hypothetical protein